MTGEPRGRVALLTFHKCGSQWVRDVLTDPEMLASNASGATLPGLNLLRQPWPEWPEGHVAGPLYNASSEQWDAHAREADRAVVVLRDPRDVAASWVASFTFSHVDNEYVALVRGPLVALAPRDRMLLALLAFYYPSRPFRTWAERADEPRTLVTRYERLVSGGREEFARVVRFLGWTVPDEILQRVLARHSFEARSGRTPGSTDAFSHFRRGVPGGWREHFDRGLGRTFEAAFPGLLVELAYEESDRWWEDLPEAAPEGAGAGAELPERHELLRELAGAREEALQLRRVCDERLKLIEELHALGQRHLRIIEDLRSR